jgi:hypothetical protein
MIYDIQHEALQMQNVVVFFVIVVVVIVEIVFVVGCWLSVVDCRRGCRRRHHRGSRLRRRRRRRLSIVVVMYMHVYLYAYVCVYIYIFGVGRALSQQPQPCHKCGGRQRASTKPATSQPPSIQILCLCVYIYI